MSRQRSWFQVLLSLLVNRVDQCMIKIERSYHRLSMRSYPLFKRFMDVSFTLVALPVVLPVGLLCAVAIKIDSPGAPVVFKQQRTGKNGRRFDMYKFRTMVPNAEAIKELLRSQNKLSWPDFKMDNDPRITRVGAVLRKTSLDEIPQLLNVLCGDMSLVGPRPTSFCSSTYNLWHHERLEVIPGLTCLWQISGRGEVEFDDRVRLDIEYIKNRSITYDMALILRTIPAMITGK